MQHVLQIPIIKTTQLPIINRNQYEASTSEIILVIVQTRTLARLKTIMEQWEVNVHDEFAEIAL